MIYVFEHNTWYLQKSFPEVNFSGKIIGVKLWSSALIAQQEHFRILRRLRGLTGEQGQI